MRSSSSDTSGASEPIRTRLFSYRESILTDPHEAKHGSVVIISLLAATFTSSSDPMAPSSVGSFLMTLLKALRVFSLESVASALGSSLILFEYTSRLSRAAQPPISPGSAVRLLLCRSSLVSSDRLASTSPGRSFSPHSEQSSAPVFGGTLSANHCPSRILPDKTTSMGSATAIASGTGRGLTSVGGGSAPGGSVSTGGVAAVTSASAVGGAASTASSSAAGGGASAGASASSRT
mmetsp:Transcript_76639/g.151912  ORF Transcript_76639/g.151912 Transcript_76639/m.151912 type:complete len:235 (-) Transcript_76639:139-843(-)